MSNYKPASNAGFIKNRGNFLFLVDRQGQVKTSNNATLASNDQKIKIFLNGVIYNNNGDGLVKGFYAHGINYINQVEGSFIIFLLDGTQLYILTDKVNSKKAFYGYIGDVWYVSNNIDALPRDKCQLSLDGIACYLANGFMLNDLTLFQEIRSTRRASVHAIENGELYSYSYWEFKFENPAWSIEQFQKYKEELEALLVEGVKRIYAASSTTALSLSAGHDSRSILGILHDKINAPNISCFSYALDDNPGTGTDAVLSKEMANYCGYPFQIIRSYDGDLIAHLKNNAREGKCLSNFCDELDAWHHLAAAAQFSDVFVGDKCFGKVDIKSGSKPDILASVFIRDSAAIRWLGNFISKKAYRQMCQSIDKLAERVFDTTKAIPDPLEKSHFLYFDQRVDHFLMPWREYFTSQVGYVHNPFLDGAVLEFFKRLPFQLRKDKFLYIATVRKMLPDLFSVGMAPTSGCQVDWHRELLKHKDELFSFVQAMDSRLDAIISKKEILHAIRNFDSWILELQDFLIKAFNYMYRHKFMEKTLSRIIGPRYHPKGSLVGHDKLLIRLLLIRIYLSPSSSEK